MMQTNSKLQFYGERVSVEADEARDCLADIFLRIGCVVATAQAIADHLTDASLCGVESHGLMRTLQYAEQFESGYMKADAVASVAVTAQGSHEVSGGGGSGIPAMQLAYAHALEVAGESGLSALSIKHVGHTGRHGAFADWAAERGFLTIVFGGGNRKTWRQVAPYGGARGLMPTNPYCIGIPGGNRGPVVLDFATSKIAGGWIYAAQSAGALLPEGCIIDRTGNPTRDPEDYFAGGAILPAGEQKGYALALLAELVGEAMLGPATTECNWLLIAIDANRFREPKPFHSVAEEILEELRECPPAPGFDRVEIPGERERLHRSACNGKIAVPQQTWEQIQKLSRSLQGA